MSQQDSPRWSRGQLVVIVGGAIASVLIWTGTLRLPNWHAAPARDEARERDMDDQVNLVFAGGIIEGPLRELPLQFEVAGRISVIRVRGGQSVRAGEVLAELDTSAVERLVHEAQLRWRIARSQREALSTGNRSPNAGSGTSAASWSHTMPAPTDAVLADQEALAESALRREQLNLEKCMLRAPRDGVILETYGQVGELIGPLADRPLLTFADAGPRRARAFVEELDALDVAPGQSAVVLVSGKADRKYEGKVLECSPYVRPKTHRHLRPGERLDVRVREVLIQLDDAEDLLIGLPVEVYVKP